MKVLLLWLSLSFFRSVSVLDTISCPTSSFMTVLLYYLSVQSLAAMIGFLTSTKVNLQWQLLVLVSQNVD